MAKKGYYFVFKLDIGSISMYVETARSSIRDQSKNQFQIRVGSLGGILETKRNEVADGWVGGGVTGN